MISATAQKYGLSPQTLWGIYGAESAYGTNEGPSSQGALGPFQFEPNTGAQYGLTSLPGQTGTIWDFATSLDAAANYLKNSLHANSSPNSPQTIAALNGYNGNRGGASMTAYAQQVLSHGNTFSGPSGTSSTTGLSQSQILQKLGYPAGSLPAILQSGKAMQAANTEAALKGLPQPFTTSAGSALAQDLLPLAAIFGAAGLPEAGTAAAAASGDAATASGAAATVGALNKLSTAGGIAAAFELFKGYLPHLLVYGGLMVLGFALLLTAAHRSTGLTVSPGFSPHL